MTNITTEKTIDFDAIHRDVFRRVRCGVGGADIEQTLMLLGTLMLLEKLDVEVPKKRHYEIVDSEKNKFIDITDRAKRLFVSHFLAGQDTPHLIELLPPEIRKDENHPTVRANRMAQLAVEGYRVGVNDKLDEIFKSSVREL